MKWQPFALLVALGSLYWMVREKRKPKPSDFTHVQKLAAFKTYERERMQEIDEERRRRDAFASERWSA